MEMIRIRDLTFEYERYDQNGEVIGTVPAVSGLSLEITAGSFTALLGENGSGKSTLGRLLNGLLLPKSGSVSVSGMLTSDEAALMEIRRTIGMVFQNPDNQMVSTVVEEDVAFGPENLGLPSDEIERRVTSALETVGMSEYRHHATHRLSGGQKQRIAIAGILAMEPRCIIFDESTAMLDPAGREEIRKTAWELNRSRGITVLWITHFMEEAIDADRVLLMKQGKIRADGMPKEVFADAAVLMECGLELPFAMRMAQELRISGVPLPQRILKPEELAQELLRIRSAVTKDPALNAGYERAVAKATSDEADHRILPAADKSADKKEKKHAKTVGAAAKLLSVSDVCYIYGTGTPYERQALDQVSFTVNKGEILAVIGPTGAGKSTLIRTLAGLCPPQDGRIELNAVDLYGNSISKKELHRRIGILFQYPEYQLFDSTVLKDVSFGPKNLGFSGDELLKHARYGMRLAGLDESYEQVSPFDLSGGEKRRAALAGVLAMKPEILVLDEPAAGLDPAARRSLYELLTRLVTDEGMTVVFVTHRMEDVCDYADRVLLLEDGKSIFCGRPEELFGRWEESSLPASVQLLAALAAGGLDPDRTAVSFSAVKEEILRLMR